VDGIPVCTKFILLLNFICNKGSCDVTIMYQPLGIPQSNTDRCMHGFNCKVAPDMWKDKMAMAEYTFDINTCGYVTKDSAQINEIKLGTHQELRGNHEPCVISTEILCTACATT
jgi:hypothetical protein